MLVWAIGLAAGLAALAWSAAMRADSVQMAYVNMAVAALVSFAIALTAIRDNMALRGSGAPEAAVASSTARHMGIVWIWGALALIAIYGTGLLNWSEWWHFVIGLSVAAALCLYFSLTLKKDAQTGRDDAALQKLGRTLAIIQLVGMAIIVLGLLIDGKMTRFLTLRYTDWAANNVFFFGALAVAAISAYALKVKPS